jgi:hypothetical protein
MTLRDVTGRVSRWTLILHRDEQGFVKTLPKLDRGRVDSPHRFASFRGPAVRRRSETRKCAVCAIEEFDARP